MNHLMRNKREIYLCNRTQILEELLQTENEKIILTEKEIPLSISSTKIENRIIFSFPAIYRLNYQPLSTDGEIIVAGDEYNKRLVVYTSPEIAKDFHNNDRCYVFVKPPEEYDKTCANADYYVDGEPLTYLNESHFYLQRMTGDDDE